MRSFFIPIFLAALCLFAISVTDVFGHHGGTHPAWELDEFDDDSFAAGVTHPFTGADHLVAMLAVGLLAFMTRRPELGAAFVVAIGLGFEFGFTSPAWLLSISVVIAGVLLLYCGPGTAKVMQLVVVAAAGFIHGGAHSGFLNSFGAGAGLCIGTISGVLLGAAMARSLKNLPPVATRFAGASVVVVGILLGAASLISG